MTEGLADDPDLAWVETPDRLSALLFQAKVAVFQTRRAVLDLTAGLKRLEAGPAPDDWVTVGLSRTPLWSDDRSREHRHQRGKVENLRRAAAAIGQGLLPAGQVFSFWRHVGRASRRRGFVDGRMLKEGCLLPAIGGGLCQMSNGLYDAALQAGCDIVERHGHSRIVPGSAAEHGQDATVAWNYVDLRFRSGSPLHLEVVLEKDMLVVQVRAPAPRKATTPVASPAPPVASSCDSCGREACFRHAPAHPASPSGRRVWLVDETWPELVAWHRGMRGAGDVLGAPLDGERWSLPRYAWPRAGLARTASGAALARALAVRRHARAGPRLRRADLAGSAAVASRLERLMTPDDLDVVVAQSLLPALWRSGRLGGRRFSVLMTRTPMAVLHARLDAAHTQAPDQASLRDFRADPALVDAEAAALAAASRIITPHAGIAALFPDRAELLDWIRPAVTAPVGPPRRRVAFPGPTAFRKGAGVVRDLALALDLEVVLTGALLEGPAFWNGVRTLRPEGDWLEGVAVVVQPAVVEDCPRPLLAALAAGVPVVATPACGLQPQPGLTLLADTTPDVLAAVVRSIVPPAMSVDV